jgi:hypothetical protein
MKEQERCQSNICLTLANPWFTNMTLFSDYFPQMTRHSVKANKGNVDSVPAGQMFPISDDA